MHVFPSGSSVNPLPHPHFPFNLRRGVHFVERGLTDLLVQLDPELDFVFVDPVLLCVCLVFVVLDVDVSIVISPADIIE